MSDGKEKPKPKRAAQPGKPTKPAATKRENTEKKAEPAAETNRAIGKDASRLIDERIRELGGWRGETLARMRSLILEADSDMVEEWKWMGTPVWSHAGNVCTGETYKQVVKLTFAKGAALEDPHGLFNSSLEGNTRRAIDIREGEVLDAEAFKTLIQAAVMENLRSSESKSKTSRKPAAKASQNTSEEKPVKLLSGGNPQIAKGDGDAPVQAYIAAMPGWKRDIGKRLDALIMRIVPNARKAVKWNTPFYGVEDQGWFISFHVFTRYIKVAFFRGTSLEPVPPGESKNSEVRYFHIHEEDPFDEAKLATWVEQAAELPGWIP